MTPDSKSSLRDEERTRCEVWSRCMGYHRPVSFWNPGKQQEHRDRQYFTVQDGAVTRGSDTNDVSTTQQEIAQ